MIIYNRRVDFGANRKGVLENRLAQIEIEREAIESELARLRVAEQQKEFQHSPDYDRAFQEFIKSQQEEK